VRLGLIGNVHPADHTGYFVNSLLVREPFNDCSNTGIVVVFCYEQVMVALACHLS
jgi:hypothetical protein